MGEPETNGVQWRLRSLEGRVSRIEQRDELLTELKYEVQELKRDVEKVLRSEQQRDIEEQRAREQATRDRRADRKWQLTVLAAWASAIIAAIAIIVPLLVN